MEASSEVTQPEGPPSIRHLLATGVPESQTRNVSPARALVRNYVATASLVDESGEERHRQALEALRNEPEAAVIEIARALGETSPQNYPARMVLILAASALENQHALPLLMSIIETPIPTEESPPVHGLGATAEEIILRTTAVDGIGRLARQGNERALSALVNLVESPIFSIRRASVQAALSARPNDEETRQRLLAVLPRNQHFLLELKSPSVAEVEQPEPRQEGRREGRAAAPPDPADRRRRPHGGQPPASSEI
jgi:hypothetical protein